MDEGSSPDAPKVLFPHGNSKPIYGRRRRGRIGREVIRTSSVSSFRAAFESRNTRRLKAVRPKARRRRRHSPSRGAPHGSGSFRPLRGISRIPPDARKSRLDADAFTRDSKGHRRSPATLNRKSDSCSAPHLERVVSSSTKDFSYPLWRTKK